VHAMVLHRTGTRSLVCMKFTFPLVHCLAVNDGKRSALNVIFFACAETAQACLCVAMLFVVVNRVGPHDVTALAGSLPTNRGGT
jgi:hypothetical protein